MADSDNIYCDLDADFFPNPITSDAPLKIDENSVKRALRNLLLLKRYEKPFHPEISSNIQDLLFANPDPITIGHIRRDIERLISLQEPRIKKMDLQFLYDVDNNQVKVNIRFVVVNLKKVFETNILLERTR